jgi:hypothetical protein
VKKAKWRGFGGVRTFSAAFDLLAILLISFRNGLCLARSKFQCQSKNLGSFSGLSPESWRNPRRRLSSMLETRESDRLMAN